MYSQKSYGTEMGNPTNCTSARAPDGGSVGSEIYVHKRARCHKRKWYHKHRVEVSTEDQRTRTASI
jgi:hypothetical protein